MPDVFLSYSREDQSTARRFAEALKREGFSVWWDQALDAGESFDKVTEQALKEAKAVVVLWSKHSVNSRWVRAEATQADRFGTLVPVTIEPCDRPIMFELTHTAELSGWSGDLAAAPWRSFIEGLRRSVGRDSGPSAATQSAPAVSSAPPAAPRISRKWIAWGVAAAGLAIVAGAAWHFLGRTAPASASTVTSAIQTSIAVLPFDDLSADKDQQYFADGVAEEILNQLARVDAKQLRVIARNSSFAFRGGNQNLKTVGEKLGVDNLLEGSVRKSGNQLRITAQLINTRTDSHLWSKTYERPLTDIFSIQDEIARAVAEALQISLGVGIGGRPGMTRNVEAYEAALQAIALASSQVNVKTLPRMTELLQRAVAEDPTYASAWIALSDCYAIHSLLSPEPDRADLQNRADAAFKEAQRLQPDMPAVLASLATKSMDARRWTEAMAYQQKFEAAAAKYGAPDNLKGTLLLKVGRIREALPLLEEYRARDPLNTGYSSSLAHAYSAIGNRAAAYAELGRIYSAGKDPPTTIGRLTALQLAMDMRDDTLLRRAIDDGIVSDLQQNVRFYAEIKQKLDQPEQLKHYLRELIARRDSIPALMGAGSFFAYLGEPQAALDAFERLSRRTGTSNLLDAWGPLFADLRRLPAFKQLVRDSGLLDYWKQYGWGDFCKPIGSDDFECS